jgi:hypothetical protein
MRRFAVVTVLTAVATCFALAARAHPPWGIAADGQGRVYFSALETVWTRVLKLTELKTRSE